MGGLNSFFHNIDNTVSGIIHKPLSTDSLQNTLPLALGVPLPLKGVSDITRLVGKEETDPQRLIENVKSETKKPFSQAGNDISSQFKRGVKNRRVILVTSGIVVVWVGVVVGCIYATPFCGAFVGGALSLSTAAVGQDQKYIAEKKAKEEEAKLAARNAELAQAYSIDGQATEQGSFGDAGGELASGNFIGVGESLDPNTLAGKKTLLVLGAGAVAAFSLYYGIHFLRK